MVLPPGFLLRPARPHDLHAVLALMDEALRAEGDPHGCSLTADELRAQWQAPGFALEQDAWVVTTTDGRIVGYEELVDRGAHAYLTGDGYVHPAFTGHGIGTALLRRLDLRAREHLSQAEPDLRVFIRNSVSGSDRAALALHEAEGYRPVRYFFHMEIELDAPPPPPAWPAGIELRPFQPERDMRAVYEAIESAFADHWGHVRQSFEQWKQRRLERDSFRPDLWHVAWDGLRVAGAAICRYRASGQAWISLLGVIREWRNRGLGLALLRQSFGEFYARGSRQVGLSTDADNPTGAVRLYEKAGMRPVRQYVTCEKELRSGRELPV